MIGWTHYRFRQCLIAKAEELGINVIIQNEAYTSKTFTLVKANPAESINKEKTSRAFTSTGFCSAQKRGRLDLQDRKTSRAKTSGDATPPPTQKQKQKRGSNKQQAKEPSFDFSYSTKAPSLKNFKSDQREAFTATYQSSSSQTLYKKNEDEPECYSIPARRLQEVSDDSDIGEEIIQPTPVVDRKRVNKILKTVYDRTVTPNVEILEDYKPWSPQVYGELKTNLVHDLIEKTELTQNSIFIDFGCGVGNVILQVAAEAGCSVYGIELNRERYEMAISQMNEFQHAMRMFDIPHGEVTIYHADFLNCEPINSILSSPQKIVVLVNNFMFEEQTRLDLLQLFLQLDDNNQIVSLKSFQLGRHKLNGWNSGDIANILRVNEYSYGKGWVSWSASEGKYYIATVDRSILRKWEEEQKNTSNPYEIRTTRSRH
ncbi:hypothetical protein G9A89_011063 [Geosiphon pyriformis]|nr:hypothetical protein G9A89_011063 [Geosiphon pyriformis]